MTGEKQMGGFVWRLGVKSTVKEDLAGAKKGVTEFEGTTTKATGSLSIFTGATKKNAEGLRNLGVVSAMAGGSLISAGLSARSAGGEFSKFSPILEVSGSSLMAVGTASIVASPLIKAFGFAHQTIQPMIEGTTAALWGEFAALSALEKGTLIGAVVGGAVLIGSAALIMAQNVDTSTKSFATQADKLKAAADAAKTYKDKLQELSDLENKLAGVPGDIRETKRQIQTNALDITQAEREWNAMDSQMRTTPEQQEAWQRKGIELNTLRDKKESLKRALAQQESDALALPGKVSAASQAAGMAGLQGSAVSTARIDKGILGTVLPAPGYNTMGATASRGSFSMQGSSGPNMAQVTIHIGTVNVNDKATWDAIIRDSTVYDGQQLRLTRMQMAR